MTSGRTTAGKTRTTLRDLLLRLTITLYVMPFLLFGIVAGFGVGGRIAGVWPWRETVGFAAMIVVCAAVVAACMYVAGLVAWIVLLAILLPAMRRFPARFADLVLVGDAPPPWYGRPFRWIGNAALGRWPLPAADAGPPAPL